MSNKAWTGINLWHKVIFITFHSFWVCDTTALCLSASRWGLTRCNPSDWQKNPGRLKLCLNILSQLHLYPSLTHWGGRESQNTCLQCQVMKSKRSKSFKNCQKSGEVWKNCDPKGNYERAIKTGVSRDNWNGWQAWDVEFHISHFHIYKIHCIVEFLRDGLKINTRFVIHSTDSTTYMLLVIHDK